MSELIQNLTKIYNTKLELKDVLETDSDIFEDYPDIAAAKIAQGGGGSPYDDAIGVADMIMDGETSAAYVWSTIMSDFGTNGINCSWSETVSIDTGEVDGNDEPIMEEKKVLFVASGIDGTDIGQSLEDYPDLYENIFPIIQNATLSVATGDDAEDGYDYVLEGELYLWNLNDMCDPVIEITENGFYPSAEYVSLGFNVDVPASGVTQGKYYFFNWLSRENGNAGDITINNPLKAQIVINNLDQLNYIEPTGFTTQNSYFDVYFYEDSAMTTEVEFDNISDAFVDDSIIGTQYNLFKDLINNDTIKYVKAEYFVWESDIDPETGVDNGTFQLDDTFTGAFTDSYTITSNDEVVTWIQIQNGTPRVFICINGITPEDEADLSVV